MLPQKDALNCCNKNPKNRTCHTCKHTKLSLTRESSYYCKLNEGEKEEYAHVNKQNCNKWDTYDKKLSRKLKLQQINENGNM